MNILCMNLIIYFNLQNENGWNSELQTEMKRLFTDYIVQLMHILQKLFNH